LIELLLHLVAASLALSLLLRGARPRRVPAHTLMLTGNLVLAAVVIVARSYDSFWSYLALGLFVGTSLVPGLLQRLTERAIARGDVVAATRWASGRALLIPGAPRDASEAVATLVRAREIERAQGDPVEAAQGLLRVLRARHSEVAAQPPSPEQREELVALEGQVAVVSSALAALAAAPPGESMSRGSRLRALLRSHRATVALMASQVVLWVCAEALGGSTDRLTLVRLGANFKAAVHAGQWQRLITSMFLHIGPLHLLLNVYALWSLGRFFEPLFGLARFWLIYLCSGLAGAAASATLGAGALSAGASGAIFGLMGAGIVALRTGGRAAPDGDGAPPLSAWRRRIVTNLVLVAVVNLAIGFRLGMIDNAAHVGGLLGGALTALLLRGLRGVGAGDGRWATRAVQGLSLAALGLTVASLVSSWTTPLSATLQRLPTRRVVLGGVPLVAPASWVEPPGEGAGGARNALTDPLVDVMPTLRAEATEAASPEPLDEAQLRRWAEAERGALARLDNVRDVHVVDVTARTTPLHSGWFEARLDFALADEAAPSDLRYAEQIFMSRQGGQDRVVVVRLPVRAVASYRGVIARALAMAGGSV
jgi:rhomboid protease GluP